MGNFPILSLQNLSLHNRKKIDNAPSILNLLNRQNDGQMEESMRSSVKSLEHILQQKGLRKLEKLKTARDVLLKDEEEEHFDANLFINNPGIQCRDQHHVKKLNNANNSESDSDLQHQVVNANEFEESMRSDVIHPNIGQLDVIDDDVEDNASISLLSLNEKNPMQFFAQLSSSESNRQNDNKYDGRASTF